MTFRSKLFLYFALFGNLIFSQQIFFASATQDYSLREWTLYDSTEAAIGDFQAVNLPNDAFQSWNLRIGEKSGYIKLRWKENPEQYDLLFDNKRISFSTIWPKQIDRWKLSTDSHLYELSFQIDEDGYKATLINSKNEPILILNNEFVMDPRDWIFTYTSLDCSDELSIATVFLVINNCLLLSR